MGGDPSNTDTLITHTPPAYHLDVENKKHLGCLGLLDEIWRIKPQLHVFGHIHGGRGVERVTWGFEQRVFEGIPYGEKGWFAVITVFCGLIVKVLSLFGRHNKQPQTILVNAASKGGGFQEDGRWKTERGSRCRHMTHSSGF